MSNKINVNLNDTIRFKLTSSGKLFLQCQHTKRFGLKSCLKFKLPSTDKNGYSTMSLWEFAGTFGKAMQLPTLNPVVEPAIQIQLHNTTLNL